MRSVRASAVLGALAALALLSSSPATTALKASPSARVGAFYFDGWAGPLSNFHFAGLLSGPFTGRRPLNGWRDESTESLRTQLTWARQDGISFFVFDWYYHPGRGNGPINNARDNYVRMKTHHGVGYALAYVNQDGFVIPRAEWAAAADAWVTNDFLNKDYVRIDGRPLLVVLDEAGFTLQMGGSASVNAAIETLQAAARRHGLPGVYVVGGRYFDWRHLPYHCSPIRCMDTDAAFVQEHWDAITQYGYPLAIEPEDGERQFATFGSAVHQFWDDVGRQSPFAFIPSIMPGWDPRPIAAGAGPDESGYPWLFGHLFWTRGSPADVGSSLRQAIEWATAHPRVLPEPEQAQPIALIEAWNELGEGSWIVPTDGDGYGYGEALASTLGVPWQTMHPRRITVSRRLKRLSGVLTVADDWTPCDIGLLRLERRSAHGWTALRTVSTAPGGSFVTSLPQGRGTYRLTIPTSTRYGQTCGSATVTFKA